MNRVNTIVPSVGRVVHVYSREHWVGPRRGDVLAVEVGKSPEETPIPEGAKVTVLVNLDPFKDDEADMRLFRMDQNDEIRHHGRFNYSLANLPVFDPSSEPIEAPIPKFWAEWMPYQVQQSHKESQRGEGSTVGAGSGGRPGGGGAGQGGPGTGPAAARAQGGGSQARPQDQGRNRSGQ